MTCWRWDLRKRPRPEIVAAEAYEVLKEELYEAIHLLRRSYDALSAIEEESNTTIGEWLDGVEGFRDEVDHERLCELLGDVSAFTRKKRHHDGVPKERRG